ncbi:hypothetical protein AN286_03660 [Aliarcobacter cryaerophilus ATCC 43158]|uniref:Membrane protein n=3 Tax=Aliarcobacter cryaerophilus TaxID=28198 RepID=A0AAD0X9T0_9BACT|nr:DUF6161 domain-containing protein [Aliarcobacter cryaerophilus]AYJ79271.1 putative membrane protein [Aliarcobacter cryaerophilus ATCC 43158]QCZ23537.1 hypothetical protein AN286_03660 [Aliarcobacter cryaerophilus ATCC 43158]
MVDNQLIEEVIKKLYSVQNKLKNSLIIAIFKAHFADYDFSIENFTSLINEFINNNNKLGLLKETDLNDLYDELNRFLNYTDNENKMLSYKVPLLDSINIIIDYFNKLKDKPNIKIKVINQPKISEDEFSKRYDRLATLLNYSSEESNLILHTKLGNQPFKLFQNDSGSIIINTGISENDNISISKSRLIDIIYKNKNYSKDEVYLTVVIEKILDNTIFDNFERQNDFDGLPNIILESKIKDLEKKNFEVLGQFSELKNLFEKRETEFAEVSEILEKSKTLESEFDNAKEAVLKNIELKQATTYWEEQVEKYDKKYKFYFKTNIGIGVALIIITFLLINYTGLFITNIPDSADKKITETISQIAHSASFFNYIIFIMFTTIMVWMMKILVKIMLSNYHLAVDANERVIMLNTYLVLLEDGKGFKESDRKVILDNIFRQTNHGIITDETSVTVADIVSSFKK